MQGARTVLLLGVLVAIVIAAGLWFGLGNRALGRTPVLHGGRRGRGRPDGKLANHLPGTREDVHTGEGANW